MKGKYKQRGGEEDGRGEKNLSRPLTLVSGRAFESSWLGVSALASVCCKSFSSTFFLSKGFIRASLCSSAWSIPPLWPLPAPCTRPKGGRAREKSARCPISYDWSPQVEENAHMTPLLSGQSTHTHSTGSCSSSPWQEPAGRQAEVRRRCMETDNRSSFFPSRDADDSLCDFGA
ncbi:hypothetical protein BCV69DRAFT_206714 [Microstroma glucosiphilum]|uniref:Uncharacterized protein n=1 Tax=Pseudomicrostroma glucosiphilum TaxID=1684307 RepID=A0A316U537_9BASI|nr:hypothetical protein BCV69DRAFT_206714 [Pseudomicrostroma glucosiphilum]PWN20349.1 hypothetical protein BCV69DRAFT_206714 [Pseudomicrostroma glucosiphilum]